MAIENAIIRKMSYSPEVAEHAKRVDNFEMMDQSMMDMMSINSRVDQNGHLLDGAMPTSNQWNLTPEESEHTIKPTENLHSPSPSMRRSSSSNGLTAQQRKGSLPSDLITNSNSISFSNEWSREKVADMAHQARQRMQHPSNSTTTTFKKIGVSLVATGVDDDHCNQRCLMCPHRPGSLVNLPFYSLPASTFYWLMFFTIYW